MFQCYAFSSKPICYDTVFALVHSLKLSATFYYTLIAEKNGEFWFSIATIEGFGALKDNYPHDLLRLIKSVAYVVANPKFSVSRGQDVDLRIKAMCRWFAPWYGLDISTEQSKKVRDVFMSANELCDAVSLEFKKTFSLWDLDNRDNPVTTQEIQTLKTSIENLFMKTEFDSEMIKLVFGENSNKLMSPESYEAVSFCIKDELERNFQVKLPEAPVPTKWLHNPSEFKILTGSNKILYAKWRSYAMRQILTYQKEAAFETLMSLIRNPIAAELELALDASSKRAGKHERRVPKVGLFEVFNYLDSAFKYKEDAIWMQSELYKRIETVISGITEKGEKERALLASTWKCLSFEEYMEIVSLFILK
jgi:hypothetical protein